MPSSVEHNMEAPYLVTDTSRRGWGVACSCGWRTPLLDERDEALAAAKEHLEVDAAAPAQQPKGFMAKRRARKEQQRAGSEDRRRR